MGSSRRRLAAAAAVAVGAAALAAVLAGGPRHVPPRFDPVPYDGRSPAVPATGERRVLVALPRPSLGQLVARSRRPLGAAAQRAYVASLEREAFALRGALRARGVGLRDVTPFARTWNGFAATVPARDLARLQSLGVRPQPVRRLYPVAAAAGVAGGALPRFPRAPRAGQAPVALLDSGVDLGDRRLRGRVVAGWDAVGRDRDPSPGSDPRQRARVDRDGTLIAGVLALAGERVLAIRVAGLQRVPETGALEEFGTTDQLLAGLERAVDPDGDGACGDAAPVAVVAVSSPFAGFGSSPEAAAIAGAAALGTLVVAGAGDEGLAAGPAGTIGSPGAAPAALTVGALVAGGDATAPARIGLEIGGFETDTAVLLGGPVPRGGLRAAAPGASADELAGRLAVLTRGRSPGAQAQAAWQAGAAAVLIADPGQRAPLPAISAARVPIPVVGLGGAAARAALAAARESGARARFGSPRPGAAPGSGQSPSRFSSRGPALDLTPKPDLAAPAAALTVGPHGTGAVVSGAPVAAARVAVAAAALRRARPVLSPAEAAALLAQRARPAGAVRATGAGALRPVTPGLLARPSRIVLRARATGSGRWRVRRAVVLVNRGPRTLTAALRAEAGPGGRAVARPARLTLRPGGRGRVRLTVAGAAPRLVAGRLIGSGPPGARISIPFLVAPGAPAPPPVGRLALLRGSAGRVTGVRFTVGRFARGIPGISGARVEAAERLVLELLGGGRVRALTPPGGARELLPGLYAYTVPRATLRALRPARYRFRARAWGPAGGPPRLALSPPFRTRP